MAHYKRHRPRTSGAGHYSANGRDRRLDGRIPKSDRRNWTKSCPRWHDKVFHIRPTRRKAALLERLTLLGFDPDFMSWPNGRKPHIYYW